MTELITLTPELNLEDKNERLDWISITINQATKNAAKLRLTKLQDVIMLINHNNQFAKQHRVFTHKDITVEKHSDKQLIDKNYFQAINFTDLEHLEKNLICVYVYTIQEEALKRAVLKEYVYTIGTQIKIIFQ